MNDQSLQTALVSWIHEIFREGIVLDDDVARFMNATFGTQDITAVLSETRDGEIDSLLELLCYPDKALQIRFESRWGRSVFEESDLAAVVRKLGAAPLRTDILSPEGTCLTTIDIPPFVLLTFVQRLNTTWRPPLQLAQVLELYPWDDRGLAVRVLLRNAGVQWNEAQISLMAHYLDKMSKASEAFETGLAFILSILSELEPGMDAFDFLVAKKFFYFQSLCRAEAFERKRRSSNMEIMILQGSRAAHGSIAQWRQNMQRIDLVCQTLFGRTQFFQQPEAHCLEVENVDTARQIQDVMRLMG